jgi:hypothetical protein
MAATTKTSVRVIRSCFALHTRSCWKSNPETEYDLDLENVIEEFLTREHIPTVGRFLARQKVPGLLVNHQSLRNVVKKE